MQIQRRGLRRYGEVSGQCRLLVIGLITFMKLEYMLRLFDGEYYIMIYVTIISLMINHFFNEIRLKLLSCNIREVIISVNDGTHPYDELAISNIEKISSHL